MPPLSIYAVVLLESYHYCDFLSRGGSPAPGFKFQFSGQCPLTFRDFRPAEFVTPLGLPDSLLRFKFQFSVLLKSAQLGNDYLCHCEERSDVAISW